jgi:glycosyltransferase involved in cell wall biosynthesis
MNLVSVIIPCYNQGKYLSETLKSVSAQTYLNWECILINDGSTDDTEAIALDRCRSDNRFKYKKKDNGGLSSARNEGLKMCSGDFIQFLDSDDLISPDKFLIQATALKTSDPCSISISDHMTFSDITGEDLPGRYLSPFLDETNFLHEIIMDWETKKSIPCHCFLIPSNMIKEYNLVFDEELPNHEDWLFWCQLFFYAKQLVFNKEKLALYRIRNDSMCNDSALMDNGFYLAAKKLKSFLKEKKAGGAIIETANKKIQELELKINGGKKGFSKLLWKIWKK